MHRIAITETIVKTTTAGMTAITGTTETMMTGMITDEIMAVIATVIRALDLRISVDIRLGHSMPVLILGIMAAIIMDAKAIAAAGEIIRSFDRRIRADMIADIKTLSIVTATGIIGTTVAAVSVVF